GEDRRPKGRGRRPAERSAVRAQARTVQPPLPGGDQPAREAVARSGSPPHDRADQDTSNAAFARDGTV
ncbi:MAG: LSU ribosomal protein L29p (L35e), partial [uncultured Sphingomonadaceae bacterium]